MKKKILVITPKFPYPSYGACEADRASGIELLIKLGFDVMVVSKVYGEKYKAEARDVADRLGITIIPVTYKYLYQTSQKGKRLHVLGRIIRPWYLDGAAYEYSEPEIRQVVEETLESFQPDLVWVDYTYLWPLYRQIRKRNIPIITRSINFEPEHFLEEDGRGIFNYIKALPKFLSEYLAAKKSDYFFAITPHDALWYTKIGFKKVEVLPLRGLSKVVEYKSITHTHSPLNVFFAGSTYNVSHNRAALEFLLRDIIPETNTKFPGKFIFHIFGGKVPEEMNTYFGGNVIKHNYLSKEEFETLLGQMDIALIPSLYGGGMQQKIFEPISRGIPTITTRRGLAEYPFEDKTHVLLASSCAEYVECLGKLQDEKLRRELHENGQALAQKLFREEVITNLIMKSINRIST